MANDKKTIGITSANAAPLLDLTSRGHFASELDAAKFAMSHAIKLGLGVGSVEGAETKWNVGSVDPDGKLRALIEALLPDTQEPYRAAEFFMNEGVKLLSRQPSGPLDVYATLFPKPD
jgi:hypothetical protein